MSAKFGRAREFDPTSEDWESYAEQMKHYLFANDVKEAKKVPVLLSTCGTATYSLIKSLCSPDSPDSKSFEDIVKLVQDHYKPHHSVIMECFRFNSQIRKSGESISVFMADLRRIAANCAFEDRLEDMLRDRLVCGVNDTQIQRRLLAEPRLTLDTALGLAQAIEAAAKDSSDVQRVTQTQAIPFHINIFRHSRGPKPQPTVSDQTCQRCGGSHSPVTCRFKNFTYRYCHKKGHLEKVCRSKKAARQSHNPRPQRDTNFVSENLVSGTKNPTPPVEDCPTYSLFTLGFRKNKPWMVDLLVNGKQVSMQIDTGASVSVINFETYTSLWSSPLPPLVINEPRPKLCTYTGEEIQVLGSFSPTISYKGQQKVLPLLVVKGDGPALLGRDWLSQLQLDWKEINFVHSGPSKIQFLLTKFATLFSPKLDQFLICCVKMLKRNWIDNCQKESWNLFNSPNGQPQLFQWLNETEVSGYVETINRLLTKPLWLIHILFLALMTCSHLCLGEKNSPNWISQRPTNNWYWQNRLKNSQLSIPIRDCIVTLVFHLEYHLLLLLFREQWTVCCRG